MSETVSSINNDLEILLGRFSSTFLEQERFGHCLIIENTAAYARISLYGGQLLSYIPSVDKRERLWLSDKAIFDGQSAIRGGAPLCWPWFGPHKHQQRLPSHGFVRTQLWQVIDIQEHVDEEANVLSTTCQLTPTVLGMHMFPLEVSLSLSISIGKTCQISLITMNNGQQTVSLSQAIHTYFAVPDINSVTIQGIESSYFNKLDQSDANASSTPYAIVAETDRVHTLADKLKMGDTQYIALLDECDKAIVNIEQSGHNGTVIWNPWEIKGNGMKDMSLNGFKSMLCIEAVTEPDILLGPGQQHTLTQGFF